MSDQELEFRELFEAAPDGILVCDLEGTIVRVNQQTERMFGYPRADVIGHRIEMLIPERFRPQHPQHVARYTGSPRTRPMGSGLELSGRRHDGSEFPIEISLSPIQTGRGPMVAAAIRDVSDRKRFEEQARDEVRRARELADAASNAKSEFLASMSHELRTPLNAVLGFAQLLQRDRKQPLSERQQERIGYVLRGGEHLLKLIDEVLDLSRIEAGGIMISPEPVDVGAVLDEVVSTLGPLANRTSVELVVASFPPDLPAVTADRTRLVQILMNFGSNAIKYNRSGGHVTFHVVPEGTACLRISVVDNGYGIPEDKRSKIFEPFQRAGQEAGTIEGTGIGLAISKRLAILMNGSVGFASDTDTGSTFWVQIPIDTGATTSLPPAHAAGASPLPSRAPARKVIYIEDNPSSIAFMRGLMEDVPGVELIAAVTAEIGLELIRAHLPAIVIMDINLPGMSGFDAVKRLKEWPETRTIPVIALSAAALERDTSLARAAGFYRYLTKPIKIDELTAVLDELLLPT